MRRVRPVVAALVVGAVAMTVAATPKAVSQRRAAEKALRSDPGLAQLDTYLNRYYGAALIMLGDGANCLRRAQRRWLRMVRDACGGHAACLRRVYLRRLAVLNALQPGATELTPRSHVTLPRVPTLVTALPPLPDWKDALHDTAGGFLARQVRGKLVFELSDPENGGIAIRDAAGAAHVIVLLSDLNHGPSQELLWYRVHHDAAATYLVRGTAARHGDFAMQRCRRVYRLPDPPASPTP